VKFLDTSTGRPYEWDGGVVWLNGELVGYAATEHDATVIAEQHAMDVDLWQDRMRPDANHPCTLCADANGGADEDMCRRCPVTRHRK